MVPDAILSVGILRPYPCNGVLYANLRHEQGRT